MEVEATRFFSEAAAKLERAKSEFFKPQEDLSAFVICQNAQLAVENFLRGYLQQEEIDPDEFLTIDELYQECRIMNRQFEKVDLGAFACKALPTAIRSCSEIPLVCNCLQAASKLECFLRQEQIVE